MRCWPAGACRRSARCGCWPRVALLRSAGVRWPQPLVLLAAAVVVTLLDPWALMQPGFWLSFVAVGLLMASEPVSGRRARRRRPARARGWRPRCARGLRTQVVASIGLAPLSMVFFQQVSLVGFVANLLAIPLVTLAHRAAGAARRRCCQPLWALASAAGAGAGAGAWRGWPAGPSACGRPRAAPRLGRGQRPARRRAAGPAAALAAAAARSAAAAAAAGAAGRAAGRRAISRCVAADIGQGTAVLVRTRGHLLLYDAGPQYSPRPMPAQRVLLPLLRARGETHIDLLMLSHRDSDHVGGAASLLARCRGARAGQLAARRRMRCCAAGRAAPALRGRPVLGLGRRALRGAAPAARRLRAGRCKPNALSCVLRVQGQGGRSLLLTGDIEAAQEAALVARHGHGAAQPGAAGAAPRQQDLVDAGLHRRRGAGHGRWCRPATAAASATRRPRCVARYRALGVELLRSDACGAWTLGRAGRRPAASASAAPVTGIIGRTPARRPVP